jgi:pimeloyl-ACP methyl ester carboxylesterase
MEVDEVIARWEADEARVRARLSAPDAEPKGKVFGRSGMEMFEAIFAGELPPAPIGDTLDITAIHIEPGVARFGSETGTPLVFLQHFRGGLDNWDPLVTDGLAQGRPVILFNNAGVASSSGETPDTIDAMGDHVAAFVNALGLPQVDVLGFSIGGYVAQAFVVRHPQLVRKLVLVGTGPRNGESPTDPRVLQVAGNPVPSLDDLWPRSWNGASPEASAMRI